MRQSILRTLEIGCLLAIPLSGLPAFAQSGADNSNLWPVYRDATTGFRISYPPSWTIVPAKGRNVRFSVNPPTGPGNCNVVALPDAALSSITQLALNREIESLSTDQNSWAEYLGLPASDIQVIETRRARTYEISALIGVLETSLESLEGKFLRK